ncbi:unnamed protein product [Prorocentrum cordatum]|uniref:Uncharacterized protein n=1 Tax=Prorocentrum cordatum TaxID=2364126 RepID=A0ABN9T4J0_9DINO|nr:unnamed protein product [Polarella glacialis]
MGATRVDAPAGGICCPRHRMQLGAACCSFLFGAVYVLAGAGSGGAGELDGVLSADCGWLEWLSGDPVCADGLPVRGSSAQAASARQISDGPGALRAPPPRQAHDGPGALRAAGTRRGPAPGLGGCTFEEQVLLGAGPHDEAAARREGSAYACARGCGRGGGRRFFSFHGATGACWCEESDEHRQPDSRFVSGAACSLEHPALAGPHRPKGAQWMQVAYLTEQKHVQVSQFGDIRGFTVAGSKLSDDEINAISWDVLKFEPESKDYPVTYFSFSGVKFLSKESRMPFPYALSEMDALAGWWKRDPCNTNPVLNFGRGHCAYTVKSAYAFRDSGPIVGVDGVKPGGVRLYVNAKAHWMQVAHIGQRGHITPAQAGDTARFPLGSKLSDAEINRYRFSVVKFVPVGSSDPTLYFDFAAMPFDSTAARRVTPYAQSEADALDGKWQEDMCGSLAVLNFGRASCSSGTRSAYGVPASDGGGADRGPVGSTGKPGSFRLYINAQGLLRQGTSKAMEVACPPVSVVAGRCGKLFGRCNADLSAGATACDEPTGWCREKHSDTQQDTGAFNWEPSQGCRQAGAAAPPAGGQGARMEVYLFQEDPSRPVHQAGPVQLLREGPGVVRSHRHREV